MHWLLFNYVFCTVLARIPTEGNGSPWTQLNLDLSPFLQFSAVCYPLLRNISAYEHPTAWQKVLLQKLIVSELLNKLLYRAEPEY
jgi:hypothetical protein